MAIIFTKQLNDSKIHFIYNDLIEVFKSDSLLIPKFCEITIGAITVKIRPNPLGEFTYNFKDVLKFIIDDFKFEDSIIYNQLEFDYNKILQQLYINYRITFTNNAINIIDKQCTFLSGYSNNNNNKNLTPNDYFYMCPNQKVKHWAGYPFDIAFHSPYLAEFIINFNRFRNVNIYGINRICNFNIDYNQNLIYQTIALTKSIFILVDYITNDCKENHYIKWINSFGVWSYWLFSKGDIDRSTKSLGEIKNQDASRVNQIGVTSQDTITVFESIESDYFETFGELLESPRVELFTGTQYNINSFQSWVQVKIKDKSNLILDKKYNTIKAKLEIELPERYTRTL